MSPRRLVHVIAPGRLAGAERVVLEGCGALVAAGHDVHVVAIVSAGDPDACGQAFVAAAAALGIDGVVLQRRGRVDPRLVWSLRRATVGASVVAHGALALAMTRLVTPSSRLTAMFHGFTSHTAGVVRAERVEVALARGLPRVCAVSSTLGEELVRRGLRPSRVEVVPNPVALRPPLPTRSPSSRARLAFVGRLSPEKNVHTLLTALAALPPSVRPGLDIVGDGPERLALEGLVAALGLQDVCFHGWRDTMDDILDVVDAVVLPSLREGTPLVLLEAATRGRPFVASAVGGIPALGALGAVGVLVPGVGVEAWQAGLLTFLADRAGLHSRARDAMGSWRDRASPQRWAERMASV